ncbi:MAG: acyl-CoA dehydrogenase C-terminal domain-containing protein, partial [Paraburkholderia hospita]
AQDPSFYGAKIATAQFFAEHLLPQAVALEASITSAKGGEGFLALSEDQF